MGNIISTRITKEEEIIFEVEVSYEEALQLEGNIKNVYLFSEDAAEIKTNFSQRGANESTKYFLIPKELREKLKFDKEVMCQKIDTKDKSIFIFVVKELDEN